MRIAVFGATGLTGRLIVTRALADGHEVTAFARDPRKLDDLRGERLSAVAGELSDVRGVGRAIAGADAVISALGPDSKARGIELSEGMRAIVAAMEGHGVKRLVVLSTASLKDPEDRFDLIYCLLVTAIRLVFRGAYGEIVRIGAVVRSSRTDWTLVRIGLLNDKAPAPVRTGRYGRGEVGLGVPRASLARFMVELASSAKYVRESPAISK
ncbi:MAG TPA: NAD(P)H-binding protein [Thermoleophilia bacterium]|nr:NAD(P)H-binding protein [Thermoleophilia bacterium]